MNEVALFEWLEKAKHIAIPVINVEAYGGYDGISYGFEWYEFGSEAKLEWWERGSKEWKPIIDWYYDFVAWLKSELDKDE